MSAYSDATTSAIRDDDRFQSLRRVGSFWSLSVEDLHIPYLTQNESEEGAEIQFLCLILWRAMRNGYDNLGLFFEVPANDNLSNVTLAYDETGTDEGVISKCRSFYVKYMNCKEICEIDKSDLLSEDVDSDFSVLKYFKCFQDLQFRCENAVNSELFGHNIEEIAVISNVDFASEDLEQCFEILDIESPKIDSLLYTDEFTETRKCRIAQGSDLHNNILLIFEKCSDLYQLSEQLAHHILHNTKILQQGLFQKYFKALMRYVFEMAPNSNEDNQHIHLKFRQKFLGEQAPPKKIRNFKKELINEITFQKHPPKMSFSESASAASATISNHKFPTDCKVLKSLAKAIAKICRESKEIDTSLGEFSCYYESLATNVIDVETQQFYKHFITSSPVNGKALGVEEKIFRKFLLRQINQRDHLEETIDFLREIVIMADAMPRDSDDNQFRAELPTVYSPEMAADFLKKFRIVVRYPSRSEMSESLGAEMHKLHAECERAVSSAIFQNETTRWLSQQTNSFHPVAHLLLKLKKTLHSYIPQEDKLRLNKLPTLFREFFGQSGQSFYLQRHLYRRVCIDNSIKRSMFPIHTFKNCFYLTTNSTSSTKNQDIVAITPFQDVFQGICDRFHDRTVHWLKTNGDELLWEKSNGSIFHLIKYRKVCFPSVQQIELIEKADLIEEADLLGDSVSRSVIISGDIGMGKSRLFQQIAESMKQQNGTYWVTALNLPDYSSFLHSTKYTESELTTTSAVKFLFNLLQSNPHSKLETLFEEKLFMYALDHWEDSIFQLKLKIVLFIDGFSEIDDYSQNSVLKLLAGLNKTTIHRIFVATHPLTEDILESTLETFAHAIPPLSKMEQAEFAQKFRLSKNTEPTAPQYQTHHLGGNPMYLEMISEILISKADQMASCLPNITTVFDLFEKYVEQIYQSEDSNVTEQSTNSGVVVADKSIFYETIALQAIISEDVLQELQPDINMLTDFRENIDKDPLVTETHGKLLQFTKKQLAEYFVVKFLNKFWNISNHSHSLYKVLIHEILVKKENHVIRLLLDGWLKKNNSELPVEFFKSFHNEMNKCPVDGKIQMWKNILKEAKFYLLEFVSKAETDIDQYIFNSAFRNYSAGTIFALLDCKPSLDVDIIFLEAVKCGHMRLCKRLLNCTKRPVNLKRRNKDGLTPVDVILREGNIYLLKLLWNYGAEVCFNDRNMWLNQFREVAKFGEIQMCELLVDQGLPLEITSTTGNTLLHCAAEFAPLEVAEWLINKLEEESTEEDYTNIRNCNGCTPTLLAARANNLYTLKFLVDSGANVQLKDNSSRSILHYAALGGNCKMVEYVLTLWQDINCTDQSNYTPLHCAVFEGNVPAAQILIKTGANTTLLLEDLSTLWHIAVQEPNPKMLDVLQKTPICINARREDGATALHLAFKSNNLNAAKILIDLRADISLKSKNENSVLHYAAQGGCKDVCAFALSIYRNINAENKTGATPFHIAAMSNNLEACKFFYKNGANPFFEDNNESVLLHFAAVGGSRDVCAFALSIYNDIDSKSKTGATPLHIAVKNNNLEACKFFIEKNADSSLEDENGSSLLHYAAMGADTDVCNLVLNIYSDINAKNKTGATPFHIAAMSNNLEACKFFYENGADASLEDNNGLVLLHYAAEGGSRDVWEFVLSICGDIDFE